MTSSIVFVEPHIPTPPPASPFRGVQILWRGWNGDEFDLTSSLSPVFIPRDGSVRGFGMPEHERWSRTAPLVAGSTHLGHQVQDREVFLPVYVFNGKDSAEFIALNRQFWKTMHPDKEGRLTVVHLDGTRRHLDCRFSDDSNYSLDADPIQRAWELYGINLLADNPYWYGDPVSTGAEAPEEQDWMADEGVDDDTFMFLSSGSSLAEAKIQNDGDVDAYPEWWLHGPFDSASVGFGTKLVSVPFAVAAGKTLVIDTSPTSRSAKLITSPTLSAPVETQMATVASRLPTATNKTKDLGANTNMNGKIPPDGVQRVSVTLTGGAGSIRLILSPLYYRAW